MSIGEVTLVALKFTNEFIYFSRCQKFFRPQSLKFPLLPIGYAIWCRRFEPGLFQGFSRIYTFPCQKFAQLAMSLHFPLPKIRTFRFSLHTSRLSLHGEVTLVALKFTLSIAKNFSALRLCSPSFKWHDQRHE